MKNDYYKTYARQIEKAGSVIRKPLTLTEKILFAHLYNKQEIKTYTRGEDYAVFRPDRVAMQDATAQMAILQLMISGKKESAVPASVHCDHLIQACLGADKDLQTAIITNKEVYDFLKSACDKYGITFWKPGAGIIHQTVLENYAFPGGMMIGTDSHTPNAGGLGMVAIGVGGADAVDVMAGMEWELKMPRIIGVKLTGELSGWTSPKDVILKLAGILTVKGGTNAVIEYFGKGTRSISATGKATICNMGAEVGATSSVFPYDNEMKLYLQATGRHAVAQQADTAKEYLNADDPVMADPDKYYDRVIEINLSELEPYVNGPFTPDAATPLSELAEKVRKMGYPDKVEVGLIGSCTNSSYQDLDRVASLADQVKEKNLTIQGQLIVNPGSRMIEHTGAIKTLENNGAIIMANACGPCIGQWKRMTDDPARTNTIVNSFNRNFAKRADGNPNTHSFVASPEITMALTIAGSLSFHPAKDKLKNKNGEWVSLAPPSGNKFPPNGFPDLEKGFALPTGSGQVIIAPGSQRLQLLQPFPAWDGKDFTDMPLLIKTKGKCTTDHISMAGPWLRFRGHLENISENLLMGAVNAFNNKTNRTLNRKSHTYDTVSAVAKAYKSNGISSIVVAEDNYGEGSSREHAAMEPRFLNVKVILAKSFARIHETNLKKQGMLAVTFKHPGDYDKIREEDKISITGLNNFAPSKSLAVTLTHTDGTTDSFEANHTYNEVQIEWFKSGSALNYNAENNEIEN
ncbi:MAG: aconitate hydratase [Tannerella sp.]|jgi:aconitate hydratase|nr:aconitate hydratase [Tannerella sp.]